VRDFRKELDNTVRSLEISLSPERSDNGSDEPSNESPGSNAEPLGHGLFSSIRGIQPLKDSDVSIRFGLYEGYTLDVRLLALAELVANEPHLATPAILERLQRLVLEDSRLLSTLGRGIRKGNPNFA
jgi:hypothetical protein